MKELNKLAYLAESMGGESWNYIRTTIYSNGYITGKDGRTIVETSGGDVPANACRFIEMADPKAILAIAESFRALEQRAEAAEAKIETALRAVDNLDAERNVLRAKLAELEESHSQVVEARDLYKKMCTSRPAPAINLADLVPDDISGESFSYIADKFQVDISQAQFILVGFNYHRAAILRNIEEQSK